MKEIQVTLRSMFDGGRSRPADLTCLANRTDLDFMAHQLKHVVFEEKIASAPMRLLQCSYTHRRGTQSAPIPNQKLSLWNTLPAVSDPSEEGEVAGAENPRLSSPRLTGSQPPEFADNPVLYSKSS